MARFSTALGVASILPLLVIGLASAVYGRDLSTLTPAMLNVLLGVMGVGMALGLVAVVTFMIDAVRAPKRPMVWRMTWVIGLGAAGVLTAPAYWYRHVRR